MDDVKTISDSLGRQFIKGVKVPTLVSQGVTDPMADGKSVLRTALLSAATATSRGL
jgi:predicted alpha/beta-hydrolase family hydrolase